MTKIWKHLLTQAYVQVKKDACQPNKNQTQLVSSHQGKGHRRYAENERDPYGKKITK